MNWLLVEVRTLRRGGKGRTVEREAAWTCSSLVIYPLRGLGEVSTLAKKRPPLPTETARLPHHFPLPL